MQIGKVANLSFNHPRQAGGLPFYFVNHGTNKPSLLTTPKTSRKQHLLFMKPHMVDWRVDKYRAEWVV